MIEVIDVRPIEFPAFEQVRPPLEEMMKATAMSTFQAELRGKATNK